MAKRLVRREVYTTINWYTVELTDEQVKLYEEDSDEWYELYDEEIEGMMEHTRDKIVNEDTDFSLEEIK